MRARFYVWLYNTFAPSMIADRWAIWRLDRTYRKNPEMRKEDAHLFESGSAGYEV